MIIAVANAHLLASVGHLDEVRRVYRPLGPPSEWQPSPHALLPALAFGGNLAITLGDDGDVHTLCERLARYRGHHVVSGAGAVAYFGPVEMWLGNAARQLGLLDEAVADLDLAAACGADPDALGRVFTEPLPSCDAYLLMDILHDWRDEQASAILAGVARSSEPGAAVLVIETVMPEGPEQHWARTLDVLMLAVTSGRERTEDEYRRLLGHAGIDLVRTLPTATPFSIVEGRVR